MLGYSIDSIYLNFSFTSFIILKSVATITISDRDRRHCLQRLAFLPMSDWGIKDGRVISVWDKPNG